MKMMKMMMMGCDGRLSAAAACRNRQRKQRARLRLAIQDASHAPALGRAMHQLPNKKKENCDIYFRPRPVCVNASCFATSFFRFLFSPFFFASKL